jgi:acyl-CoA reductase-like NAD-dependent aldehyde dehydrogenase
MSVNEAIDSLLKAEIRKTGLTIRKRYMLCKRSLDTLAETAEAWSEAGAFGKQCPGNPNVLAEEMLTGPVTITRLLRLASKTLEQFAMRGKPKLAGTCKETSNRQCVVPIFPTHYLWDRLTFMGLSAEAIMQPGVSTSNIHGQWLKAVTDTKVTNIVAVLGAGNVSAVPATDSLHRILFQSQQVILKMNPVNDYLHPIFEKAFSPFIEEGMLRIICGGVDVGNELIHHPDIAEVHITGSTQSHDRIVWGSETHEQDANKATNTPILAKPVTSELGNVTPWIVVPGSYTNRQLDSQAQHIAASITNNAGFNCLATRVVVTSSQWPQRSEFLSLIDKHLAATPLRPAYYPGAVDRYRKFTGQDITPDPTNRLPWAFIKNQDSTKPSPLFKEETFVGVCVEATIATESPDTFLKEAVDFCNQGLAGTLCASMTVPQDYERTKRDVIEQQIQRLRYSTVCINQWSGLAYSLLTPPWGGYPGATLQNIESGIGSVHNTFLLDRYEKSVLRGPLVSFPKPVWFPTNKNALAIARHLLALYQRPSLARFLKLLTSALTA